MIGSAAGLPAWRPGIVDLPALPQRGHAAGVWRGTSRWTAALSASLIALGSFLADTQASADVFYRGWLQSERGPLAVLTQDGRDVVVAVGEAVGPEWRVIAIGAASVGAPEYSQDSEATAMVRRRRRCIEQ